MLVAVRALPLPDPGTPPLIGPIRLLWWQAMRQKWILLTAVALGMVVFICQAVQPYLVGRAIDEGLSQGFGSALWGWGAILLGVGALLTTAAAIGHRYDVQCWMRGAFGMSQLVGKTVSESGDAITEELPTGEVVSAVANDSLRLAEIYAIAAQFIGSLTAYVVVAGIMLNQSVELGLIVVLGLPAVAAILSLLIKPLQQRQSAQRDAAGRLTTLGADTVSGLRILRGIGGEQVFTQRYRVKSQEVREAGVRVAGVQSLLDALQVLLPGVFVAFVVYLGAMKAIAGEITPGELVAFYGYSAFLGWPLQIATQTLQVATRAHVAAKKLITVLSVTPAAGAEPGTAPIPEAGSVLEDETSGLRLEPGRVVALVCEDPDASAAVATRLGRFDDDAERATPVRLGGTLLRDLHHADVRGRVVVAEATPQLFSGALADELDVHGTASRDDLVAAITIADAHDVIASVPDGLDGVLPEKGRSLSGGQRQRVALARAILTSPEILVLIEPTSAVDAHTEARIAVRLAEARAGRTTLIVTASPLVLGEVDDVAFLDGGVVTTQGTHRELLDRPVEAPGGEAAARYRAVVGRDLDADDAAATHATDQDPDLSEGARR